MPSSHGDGAHRGAQQTVRTQWETCSHLVHTHTDGDMHAAELGIPIPTDDPGGSTCDFGTKILGKTERCPSIRFPENDGDLGTNEPVGASLAGT